MRPLMNINLCRGMLMTEDFSEAEAERTWRRTEELRKATKILSGPATPALARLVSFLATAGLMYLTVRYESPTWTKALAGGCVVGLLNLVVEQWSVRSWLEAAICLLLSREAGSSEVGVTNK